MPIHELDSGDVFVFKFPEDPERDFIKRVIGLPGDKIELRNSILYRNGERVDEPYTFRKTEFPYRPKNERFGPVIVPPDHYFAMGDNRNNSLDSRDWGFVPAAYVKGRAWLVYWSYETQPGEHLRNSVKDRFSQIFDVVIHFFTKTRWSRFFMIIR